MSSGTSEESNKGSNSASTPSIIQMSDRNLLVYVADNSSGDLASNERNFQSQPMPRESQSESTSSGSKLVVALADHGGGGISAADADADADATTNADDGATKTKKLNSQPVSGISTGNNTDTGAASMNSNTVAGAGAIPTSSNNSTQGLQPGIQKPLPTIPGIISAVAGSGVEEPQLKRRKADQPNSNHASVQIPTGSTTTGAAGATATPLHLNADLSTASLSNKNLSSLSTHDNLQKTQPEATAPVNRWVRPIVNVNDNDSNRAYPIVNDSNRAYRIIPKRSLPNTNTVRVKAQYPPKVELPSIDSILARNMPKPVPPPPNLIEIANKLDFIVRPRPTRDGLGTIPIEEKNGLKITSDMKYLMMLYAIDMGYSISERNHYYYDSKNNAKHSSSDPSSKPQKKGSSNSSNSNNNPPTSLTNISRKNKKVIHEAACKLVCYDYGLLKPIGSTTLQKAFETFRKRKYSTTVNLFETRHQDRGRKSYVQQMEETHPGHLKVLFMYAKERSDEYTKYDDYRKMMVERSKKVKPGLDFKLSMNDLMMFFDKFPKLRPRGMPKRKRPGSNSDGVGGTAGGVSDADGGMIGDIGVGGGGDMVMNHAAATIGNGFVGNAAIGTSGAVSGTGVAAGNSFGDPAAGSVTVGTATGQMHGISGDLNAFCAYRFEGNGHMHSPPPNMNRTVNMTMNQQGNILNHSNGAGGGAINTHLNGANMTNNVATANLTNVGGGVNGSNLGIINGGSYEGIPYGSSGLGNTNGNIHMHQL
jgi:hypothetical protein